MSTKYIEKIEQWCKENDVVQYKDGDKIYNLDYDGYTVLTTKLELVIKTISDARCLLIFDDIDNFSISVYKIIKVVKSDYYPDFNSKLEFDLNHLEQFNQWLTINTIFTSFPKLN